MIYTRHIGIAVLMTMVWFTSACGHRECAHVTNEEPSQTATLPYYDFFAPVPPDGYCEKQVFGARAFAAEPINALFSLTTFLLGVLGVIRSRKTTMVFQVLFGFLAAYGLSGAVYHISLDNGFYRVMDVTLGIIQSFTIIMLFHSLYLYRVEKHGEPTNYGGYRLLAALVTLIFTIYPAAVHVAGVSSASPWVAWLVFDVLWLLIATLLILIWRRRNTWPRTQADARVFKFVWYSIGFCTLAYAGWCLDKFVCNCGTPWMAYLHLHGWWHFFIGLCFYYMINLCRFFSAQEYGYEGVLQRFPEKGLFFISFVEWKRPEQ